MLDSSFAAWDLALDLGDPYSDSIPLGGLPNMQDNGPAGLIAPHALSVASSLSYRFTSLLA